MRTATLRSRTMSLPPEFLSTVFLLEDPPVPLPDHFAIITAWNPEGLMADDVDNETADRILKLELDDLGLAPFRATGCSPDLSHREPGWAVVLSKVEAIALGRRYRQLAVWRIEDDALILIDCATAKEERIARFSERIVGR
ncbi:MAG: hypothetical protein B9S38_09755 [Verrucomicrobiia bacterium Tous-C4TDCM]|jgi:hypothetical protein|nr:MAG: hypothetical protein B9S38_09755 [Verrucomicrobiae bacterium Tous-C4TDCM]